MSLNAEVRLQLKELELNSLFETIRAINDNASEDHLYKIYRFTLYSNKHIGKMALYVLDEETWACKAVFGTKNDFRERDLPEQFRMIGKITQLVDIEENTEFSEFDFLIPVKHKDSVLALVFIGKQKSILDDELLDTNFIEALSNIIIVAIENKKLVRRQLKEQALRKQLEIAKQVQSLLFPKKLPYTDQLKVVASYLPHHSVGGDYYDFIQSSPQKFMICIADVSGKGVPAAILMSNFQAALRILIRKQTPLRNVVEELNQLIIQNSGNENFITAFFCEYDIEHKSLTYINSGHNPPFLFTNDNQKQFLSEGSTILGAFQPLPFLNISTLNGLDNFLLFCFTDGFIETYNDRGDEFGTDQLYSYIDQHKNIDPKELHEKLIRHLYHFKGGNAYPDDITLLS
jgi:phosphoserine phosphatase RsbU/P